MTINWQISIALIVFCLRAFSAEAFNNSVDVCQGEVSADPYWNGFQTPESPARNFVHVGSYEERYSYFPRSAPDLNMFKESTFTNVCSTQANVPRMDLAGQTTIAACIKSAFMQQGAKYPYRKDLTIEVYDYSKFVDSICVIAAQLGGEIVTRKRVSKMLKVWFLIDNYGPGFHEYELTVKPGKVKKYKEIIKVLHGYR